MNALLQIVLNPDKIGTEVRNSYIVILLRPVGGAKHPGSNNTISEKSHCISSVEKI